MKQKALFILIGTIIILVLLMLACESSGSIVESKCNPATFTGKGDDVIDVGHVHGCTKATLTHDGEHNFIVTPYDADNSRHHTLVNEIGIYNGTIKWNAQADTLEIKADGAWSIRVE